MTARDMEDAAFYGLTVLSIMAALSCYWSVCRETPPLRLLGKWAIAIGWSMMSLRLLGHIFVESITVTIHPISMIALSMIAGGTVLVNLRWLRRNGVLRP